MSEVLEDESQLMIWGNRELIKTAFANLIENGCKYSGDNKVNVKVSSSNQKIILEFSDNGIGIEKEELKLIFKPFYRAKNAIETKGHGIGLSLVENIILFHKGSIDVKSEINTGTSFTVSFPVYHF